MYLSFSNWSVWWHRPSSRPSVDLFNVAPVSSLLGQRGANLPYTILIVDDNALIRRYLRSCFEENSDWAVCGEAINGRDAIEKARIFKPDLIILDLSMPVMNGFEAARELKRISPHVPLLMFTSYKTPNLEKEAVAAGCAAVFSKSDSQDLLIDRVQELLTAAA
jgi:DNA-binding NarL/FixJ family response regulator